jgi:hypothetical protein
LLRLSAHSKERARRVRALLRSSGTQFLWPKKPTLLSAT